MFEFVSPSWIQLLVINAVVLVAAVIIILTILSITNNGKTAPVGKMLALTTLGAVLHFSAIAFNLYSAFLALTTGAGIFLTIAYAAVAVIMFLGNRMNRKAKTS